MSRDERSSGNAAHAGQDDSGSAVRSLSRSDGGAPCGDVARQRRSSRCRQELTRLQDLSAEQTSNFCGQCHRTWAEIAMQGNPSIANIRFQPYRLTGANAMTRTMRASVAWLATIRTRRSAPGRRTTMRNARHVTEEERPERRPVRFRKASASPVTCRRSSCRARTTNSPIIGSAIVKPNEPYPG